MADCVRFCLKLMLLSCSRNLQKLSLYGDTCVLQDEGILDSADLNQVDQGGVKIKE